MATYRITGDPRTAPVLEKILNLILHLDAFGIAKTGLTFRLTAGGQLNITTDKDLPAGEAEHLGAEVV